MKVNEQVYRIAHVILGVLFAFFIVLNGRWNLIGEVFFTPSFYIGVMVNFCMTYSLLYIIHIVTTKLDKHLDWNENYILRPLLQFILAICIPLLLALLFATLYTNATGQKFETSDYLEKDFPFISIFVLLVNGFYPILYFLTPERSVTIEDKVKNRDKPEDSMVVQYNGDFVTLGLLSDVLYFHRDGKLVKLHTISGVDYAVHKPIATLITELPNDIYCQINRSTIVNTSFLKGYSMLKRNSLQARFKMQYHPYIKDREDDRYKVTKEHIENFKSLVRNIIK